MSIATCGHEVQEGITFSYQGDYPKETSYGTKCWACIKEMDVEDIFNSEIVKALKELELSKTLVKDICEEWNEGCEPTCDSFAHEDNCKRVNIAEAKKAMRLEIEESRELLTEIYPEIMFLKYHHAINGNNEGMDRLLMLQERINDTLWRRQPT